MKEVELNVRSVIGCSKHMIGNTKNILLLKAVQGACISFGDGKKGSILGVGTVEKSLEESIENVYYVRGSKYSFLVFPRYLIREIKFSFHEKNAILQAFLLRKRS